MAPHVQAQKEYFLRLDQGRLISFNTVLKAKGDVGSKYCLIIPASLALRLINLERYVLDGSAYHILGGIIANFLGRVGLLSTHQSKLKCRSLH